MRSRFDRRAAVAKCESTFQAAGTDADTSVWTFGTNSTTVAPKATPSTTHRNGPLRASPNGTRNLAFFTPPRLDPSLGMIRSFIRFRVQRRTHCARERRRCEGLLEKRHRASRQSTAGNLVVGVAGHVQHDDVLTN